MRDLPPPQLPQPEYKPRCSVTLHCATYTTCSHACQPCPSPTPQSCTAQYVTNTIHMPNTTLTDDALYMPYHMLRMDLKLLTNKPPWGSPSLQQPCAMLTPPHPIQTSSLSQQECHCQVLRRRHHSQKEIDREAEGGKEEACSANWRGLHHSTSTNRCIVAISEEEVTLK